MVVQKVFGTTKPHLYSGIQNNRFDPHNSFPATIIKVIQLSVFGLDRVRLALYTRGINTH